MSIDVTSPEVKGPIVDLSVSSPSNPVLPKDEVYRRATRHDIALGSASPGVESIQKKLETPGGEQSLVQMAASKEQSDKLDTATEVLKTAPDLTPEFTDAIVAQATAPADTDGILERFLAKEVVNTATANSSDPGQLNQIEPDTANTLLRATEDNIAVTSIIDKYLTDQKAAYEANGWGTYLYEAAPTMVIPGLSWFRQYDPRMGNWQFQDENKSKDYETIMQMKPADADRFIKQRLSEMNTTEGLDWMYGLADYNHGQYTGKLDRFFNYFDIATVAAGPAKALGKGLKEMGKQAIKEAAGKAAIKRAERDTAKLGTDLRPGWREESVVTPQDLADAGVPVPEIYKYMAEQHLKNQLSRLDASVKMPKAGLNNIAAANGLTKEAAVGRMAEEIALDMAGPNAPKTIVQGAADLVKKLPSWANPDHFGIDMAIGHYPKVAAMRETWDSIKDNMIKLMGNRINIDRTPEEIQKEFLQKVADLEEKRFKDIKDAVLHVKTYTQADNPITNTAGIEVKLGKTSSELFRGEGAMQVADNTARDLYGLPKGSYSIIQEGDGYAIHVRRDLDETLDEYRNNILKADEANSRSRFNKVLGFIPVPKVVNSFKDTVSPFLAEQRALATHAETLNQVFFQNATQSIQKLSSSEMKRLSKIMNVNMNTVKNGQRGAFYSSVPELEEAWILHNKSLPTANEVEAYFNYVMASDLDWMGRSFGLFTSKSREGVRRMSTTLNGKAVAFDGVFLERLPKKEGLNGGVLLSVDKNSAVRYLRLEDSRTHEIVDKLVKDGKARIIQTYAQEDSVIKDAAGTHGPVNFVITNNVKDGALDLTEQLPYRPGFHVKYTDPYFIKVPRVGRDSAGRLVYYGDQAVMGVNSKAQGEKFGKLLERAKNAIHAKDETALDAVIREGLPMSKADLKRAFKDLDPKFSFAVVKDGVRIGEASVRDVNGKALRDVVGDSFADFSNNPLDMSRIYNQEYTGSKDMALWGVDETRIAGDSTSLPQLVDASTLDPVDNQIQAMQKLMYDRFYNDLKVASAETFVEEFGVKAGLLQIEGKTLTVDELRRNPIRALYNATVSPTDMSAKAQTARQVQRAAKNLVRSPTKLGLLQDHIVARLRETAYTTGGAKRVKVYNSYVEPLLSANLPQKMRALAFHAHLGMFNPTQIFLQGQTAFAINAISPLHGPAATEIAVITRKMQFLRGDAEAANKLAETAAALTPGWTKEMVLESDTLMGKTGWDFIKGDYGQLDVVKEPKVFTSTKFQTAKNVGNKILEWSPVFFNETERFVRTAAWHTAYSEYVKKLPKLAGKLSSTDAKKILSRAQDLSMNMTRDANAFWQTGAASMMTQFWGYSGRMFDILTGSRISAAEKTRLLIWNSMAYGVPMSLNAAISPVYPWQDLMREQMYANGIDPNSGVADAVMNGLLASIISGLGGPQLNVGDRWGPQGIQVLWNLMHTKDNSNALYDVLFAAGGVSASDTSNWITGMVPLFGDLADIATGNGDMGVFGNDALNYLRNISTVNNTVRAIQAATAGTYVSKKGYKISSDLNFWDGVTSFLTGISRQSEKDSFLLTNIENNRKDGEAAARSEAQKYINMYWDSYANGDVQSAKAARDKISAILNSAGFDSNKISKLIIDGLRKNSMQESNQEKYIKGASDKTEENVRRKIMENQ